MNLNDFKRNIKQYGVFKTFEDLALRALNRGVFFKILKGIKIDAVHPELLSCDQKYHGLFLTESMLAEFAKHPEYELSKRFLSQALAKGDEGIPISRQRSTRQSWFCILTISSFTCTRASPM
jgi:hypothetical protein